MTSLPSLSSILATLRKIPQYAYVAIIIGFLIGFLFSGGITKLRNIKDYFGTMRENASFVDSAEYENIQKKIQEEKEALQKQEIDLESMQEDFTSTASSLENVQDSLPRYLSVSTVESWREYVIQMDETLQSIGEKFDISISALQEKNPEAVVIPGNTILVPDEYADWIQIRVKTSDTWKSLSEYYQVPVSLLQEINNRENLVSDTILRVPNMSTETVEEEELPMEIEE